MRAAWNVAEPGVGTRCGAETPTAGGCQGAGAAGGAGRVLRGGASVGRRAFYLFGGGLFDDVSLFVASLCKSCRRCTEHTARFDPLTKPDSVKGFWTLD